MRSGDAMKDARELNFARGKSAFPTDRLDHIRQV
jgi:hypothetical protein